MRLLIKQKVFSWTDAYDVYNESYEPVYRVKAEFFTIGHVIHLWDNMGSEVGCIRQRVLAFLPKFELEMHGQAIGLIRKEFSLFRPHYVLECNGWRISGDVFGWSYSVLDGDRIVMQIEKKLFRWGDTYVLNIPDPNHAVMGLLIAIAIDAANCGDD